MHPSALVPVAWLAALLLGSACSPVPAEPTWHEHVAPLVAERCATCHQPGQIGPFALQSYEDAAPVAALLASAVESGSMPPWDEGTTAECSQPRGWMNDPRLTDNEKQIFRNWAETGAAEGDPADAAPLPEPVELGLGQWDVELPPAAGYTVAGDGDSFRCFVFDPGFTETTWIRALEVVPSNLLVAHHALVWVDEQAQSQALADGSGQYDCFGSAGVTGPLAGGWVPGAGAQRYPEDSGLRVEPGALFAMQMHYNGTGSPELDEPVIRLQTTTEQPALRSQVVLLGNAADAAQGLQPGPADGGSPRFFVPAGTRGHTETSRHVLPSSLGQVGVFMVGAHMHLVGTDMRISVERGGAYGGQPPSECLLQTPTYDYHWQRFYQYDEPDPYDLPRVRGGDTVELRCTFDNTTDNRNLAAALVDEGLSEPVDVSLGEGTFDEMCIGVFGVVTPG